MSEPKQFFISYNRRDRRAAEWIAWQLESAGYTVVIQAWDFQEGQNFVLSMQRAINSAQRTLVVLSPDFLASQFTAPEWAAAFAKDPTGERGLLLPVRVRNCEPTGLLGQIVYIDLVGLRSKEDARKRLLAGVDRARRKPTQEPDLPPLRPSSRVRPKTPEPSWGQAFKDAGKAASSALWRIVRILFVALVVAVASYFFLGSQFLLWKDRNPAALIGTSIICGALAGLAAETVVYWGGRLLRWLLAPPPPRRSSSSRSRR